MCPSITVPDSISASLPFAAPSSTRRDQAGDPPPAGTTPAAGLATDAVAGIHAEQQAVDERLRQLDDVLQHYSSRIAADDHQRLRQSIEALRGASGQDADRLGSHAQRQAGADAAARPRLVDVEQAMLRIHGELMRALESRTTRPRVVRDMPRLPTEIMAHWIAALQSACEQARQHGAIESVRQPLHEALEAAKRQWLRHDLTVAAVDTLLEAARESPAAMMFPRLDALARHLLDELHRHGDVAPAGTRQFDNVYGRTFESALIGHLVADPPAAVKEACRTLNAALARALEGVGTERRFGLALRQLQDKLKADPRFWMPEFAATHPQFGVFLALSLPELTFDRLERPIPPDDSYGPAIQQGFQCLLEMLGEPVASGIDCVAASYLLAKVLPAMSDADIYLPGKLEADVNYGSIKSQSGRRELPDDLLRRKWMPPSRVAGITLAYQPAAIGPSSTHAETLRPALLNEPEYSAPERADFGRPAAAPVEVALAHGIPYVSGLSGTTNMLIHFAHDVDQRALLSPSDDWPRIDLPHAMLAAMMFLTYDGGHSLHEALWTLNQTEAALQHGVPTGGHANDPNAFKADYEAYFASFAEPTRSALNEASNRAFSDMARMRAQYVNQDPFRP